MASKNSVWWPPAMMTRRARPASGATSMASIARVSSAVSTRWTSSSRRFSATVTTTSAVRPAKRAALASSASQAARRGTRRADWIRSERMSPLRKFSCTNWPRVAANWSLRSTINAVCGIGRAPWARATVTTTNRTVPPARSAVARRRAAARSRTRSALDSGPGPGPGVDEDEDEDEDEGAREAVIGAVGPIWQPPVSPRYRAETAISRANDQIGGATMISHDATGPSACTGCQVTVSCSRRPNLSRRPATRSWIRPRLPGSGASPCSVRRPRPACMVPPADRGRGRPARHRHPGRAPPWALPATAGQLPGGTMIPRDKFERKSMSEPFRPVAPVDPTNLRPLLFLDVAREMMLNPDWSHRAVSVVMESHTGPGRFSFYGANHPDVIEDVHARRVTSVEDIAAARYPLRVSVRGSIDACTPIMVDVVLRAHGFSLDDLKAWGGEIRSAQPMPNHPSRIGRLAAGEIDAIFDEGVVMWADQVAAAGARFLPLSPRHLESLEAQGFRRGLIEKSRYPSLPADVPAVDYSGWPIYCRTDTPDALVGLFCEALVRRRDDIVWDIGSARQPPLPLERMVKESPLTPLDVPMHPRAAAVWRQHGYL